MAANDKPKLTALPSVRRRAGRYQSPRYRAKRLLLGGPLQTSQLANERITKTVALAVFSSDPISSTAYGTEFILLVLVTAQGATRLTMPVSLAIGGLLLLLVISYRQVIDAYPGGGGAYAVSRANLEPGASLLGAAALVVDDTLTVAVSTAAGVASLASAFPGLGPATVPICLIILAVVTLLNLRGLGAAARAFLLPTLVFIIGLLAIIAIGLIHRWRCTPLSPAARCCPPAPWRR